MASLSMIDNFKVRCASARCFLPLTQLCYLRTISMSYTEIARHCIINVPMFTQLIKKRYYINWQMKKTGKTCTGQLVVVRAMCHRFDFHKKTIPLDIYEDECIKCENFHYRVNTVYEYELNIWVIDEYWWVWSQWLYWLIDRQTYKYTDKQADSKTSAIGSSF